MHLFHRELGGRGNPPLVILHGLLGSSRNWQTAGIELAARFHVFALDLRNHGKSPHADEMSFESMMGDVVAWLDEHQLSSAVLMGHSMGGKLAMLLACRYPNRVSRLVAVDIAPKDYSWMGHRAMFAAMSDLNLSDLKSRADAELRFEGRVPSWSLRKFLTTNLEHDAEGRWRWQINLTGITKALPALEANPMTGTDRYDGPMQLIVGGKSDYVSPGDHDLVQRHFPRAEITVLPSSGHNPHMEAREAFVRAVNGASFVGAT